MNQISSLNPFTLPSITIITPSYNQGHFIKQTIESVLSQNYPKTEFIILDALSTDHTAAVVAPYLDKLTFISEKDSGQTNAINKGVRMATGDIICWLNSDDFFFPNTLYKVGEFFANHPQEIWFTGDCRIINEQSETIQEPIRLYKRILRSLSPIFYIGLTNAICQPSTFWRRSLHDQLGLLDESLRYTMDYDWWLRLMSIRKPTISNDQLAAFRIHGDSKGGSQYVRQLDEDYSTFVKYNFSIRLKHIHQLHNEAIKAIYKLIK